MSMVVAALQPSSTVALDPRSSRSWSAPSSPAGRPLRPSTGGSTAQNRPPRPDGFLHATPGPRTGDGAVASSTFSPTWSSGLNPAGREHRTPTARGGSGARRRARAAPVPSEPPISFDGPVRLRPARQPARTRCAAAWRPASGLHHRRRWQAILTNHHVVDQGPDRITVKLSDGRTLRSTAESDRKIPTPTHRAHQGWTARTGPCRWRRSAIRRRCGWASWVPAPSATRLGYEHTVTVGRGQLSSGRKLFRHELDNYIRPTPANQLSATAAAR